MEWVPTEGLVDGQREVKTPEEIDAMRLALAVTERVLAEAADLSMPGMSERQVAVGDRAAFAGGRRRRAGLPPHRGGRGQRRPAPPPPRGIPAQGTGAHHHRHGGARVAGYCADLTRTVILGEPTARFREIYGIVAPWAQIQAEAGLKAGMDTLAGDALAREIIVLAGFGEAFGTFPGPRCRSAVHEAPSLSPVKERRTIFEGRQHRHRGAGD